MDTLKFFVLKVKALSRLFFFILKNHNLITKNNVLFFFPFYHTGGAEKVHVDIVNSFKTENTFIFFEGKSDSNSNKDLFTQSSDYYEIFEFLNRSKYIRKLFLSYLTTRINKSKNIHTVFASNSSFFYRLIPKLDKEIKKIDLTHAFSYPDKGGEISSLPYVPYITNRIVINKKTYLDYKALYSKNNLNKYLVRIKVIQNGVSLNNEELPVKSIKNIKVGYIGRWSKEKRPELFLNIASKVIALDSKFSFYFVGTNNKIEQEKIKEHNVISLGEIKNNKDLKDFYKELHFVLITSYREGFPIVLMEAMSFGVVPICTNVGGISEHIKHNENGFLIDNNSGEEKIISDFLETISSIKMKEGYLKLSENAYNYAQENFNLEKFKKSYRELILDKNTTQWKKLE